MASIKNLKAFNFQGWIEENKDKLKASGRQRAGFGKTAK